MIKHGNQAGSQPPSPEGAPTARSLPDSTTLSEGHVAFASSALDALELLKRNAIFHPLTKGKA